VITVPGCAELLQRAAERNHNLGSVTAALLRNRPPTLVLGASRPMGDLSFSLRDNRS
jgi:hypothetical protein